ncbi:EspA/EspE family type VII secretion system effector [Mycolicibacterium llatzerense]|uniref:EspA/EspE family type VII secretion system effector n=1 Tax=Mycolicibacterium llatzerense TaxID=280871 RepID=UPI0031D8A787
METFNSIWDRARATFGEGVPVDGTGYDDSSQFREFQSQLQSATPGTQWTGRAADKYSDANDAMAGKFGRMAELDRKLGVEVTRSAEAVMAGRRELDAVRRWVNDAATGLPKTAAGDAQLNKIVVKGSGEIADIIKRTHGDMAAISGRVNDIRAAWEGLADKAKQDRLAPGPLTDIKQGLGDGTVVPGNPVRPFDGVLTDEEWRIARLSPTLLDEYEEAKAKGWQFTSVPGKGTYTDSRAKIINIDPDLAKNGPFQRVNAISHELGHALKSPPVDQSSKDAYVDSLLDGEGAACMNTMKIEREILAAGGPEIIPPQPNDDHFKTVYDTYLQTGSTSEGYQQAIREIGRVWGTLIPSTDPSTTYREYYGRGYHR